jgi:LysR family cyn operon transcriptional activator
VIAREVAAGRLDLGFGFATDARPGVRPEPLCDEPAIVAVDAGHPLAGRRSVGLRELAGETFALVDPSGGEGYNRAVRDLCAAAGFRVRVARRPSGPMAWEAAVRRDGCVGLTTHVSAASSMRGIRTLELTDDATFQLDLLWPSSVTDPTPAAASLAAVARRLAGSGSDGRP